MTQPKLPKIPGLTQIGIIILISLGVIVLVRQCNNTIFTSENSSATNSEKATKATPDIPIPPLAIPLSFDNVLSFSEGLAAVKINGKYGYIDQSGTLVIQSQFEDGLSFSEGLARVKLNGNYGFIDKLGKVVIQPQFSQVDSFFEGLAVVNIGGKYGYIDKNTNFVIQPVFKSARRFNLGLAIVEGPSGFKFSHIDKNGKSYNMFGNTIGSQDLGEFSSEKLAPLKDGKWGYVAFAEISVLGYGGFLAYKVQPKFDDARPFSEGLGLVRDNNKWGYINEKGTFITPIQFDDAQSFSEGLAVVKSNGKYGYIDETGNFIIQPSFDDAQSFSEGLAVIKINGKYGYIDKTGKTIIQPSFDTAQSSSEGLAAVLVKGKWGFVRNPLKQ